MTSDPGHAPLLLFDGACGFCTACVDWLAPRLARRTRILPWQEAGLEELGLARDDAAATVWWIEPDGARFAGAEAVAQALLSCRDPWPRLGRALLLPGIRHLAHPGYAFVARLRGHLPGVQPACEREGGVRWGGALPHDPATRTRLR